MLSPAPASTVNSANAMASTPGYEARGAEPMCLCTVCPRVEFEGPPLVVLDHGKVASIQGQDLAGSHAVGEHNNGRINSTERQIAILSDEFADPNPVFGFR